LIQLKKPVEGHKELKLATEYEPNVSFYHACLGTFLYRDGDLAGAERSWRKALTIDPKNPVLLFELGRVLQDQGRIDAAVKQYHDSLFALEKASLDPTGKNYIDPNGSYFSIDRLRDAVTGRLREIEEARKK
jgi:Flp pilus assembly protein TadD